jgi:hypothetical protein
MFKSFGNKQARRTTHAVLVWRALLIDTKKSRKVPMTPAHTQLKEVDQHSNTEHLAFKVIVIRGHHDGRRKQ